MTLGTMIPNNDCPSYLKLQMVLEVMRHGSTMFYVGQRTKLRQKEKFKDENLLS
jgi:hypothetical protein